MKILGKILSVALVLIILSFSIFSVMGYSYYIGDNEQTVMRGADDLKLATDLDGGVRFTLKAATADEVHSVVDVIEKRVASMGLVDYSLYVQDSTGYIDFVIPEDVPGDFDATELASFLTCTGYVTIRPDNLYQGVVVDSSGSAAFIGPYSTTSDSILMNSDYITGASSYEYKENGETYHYVNLVFNSEGSQLLSQISDPNLSSDTVTSFYNSTVSVWLDDRMIAYPTLTEHFDIGEMSFTEQSITDFKAELYAAVINSGAMPCELQVVSITSASSISGTAPVKAIFIVAFVALILIAFVTIYRYRVNGIITALCTILTFTFLLSKFTGFFPSKEAFILNIPAVCAWILSMILTALSCMLICERIRQNLLMNTPLSAAFKNGFASAASLISDVNIVFAVISLVGVIMFGGSGFATALFGNTLCGGIYRFCDVMLWGSLINFITGLLLPRILMANFKNFRLLAKTEMFGGKKNDKK